jgi:hypothetical protein
VILRRLVLWQSLADTVVATARIPGNYLRLFPATPARNRGNAGTFWIYAGICLAGSLFIRWRLPETKGQTLEEIEEALTN